METEFVYRIETLKGNTRLDFNLAKIKQKATYSVEVLANHNNQLERGAWIVFYVTTGDFEDGSFRRRRFVKFDKVGRGLKTEVFEYFDFATLAVKNDWEGDLFNLIILIRGQVEVNKDFEPILREAKLRWPIILSYRNPCAEDDPDTSEICINSSENVRLSTANFITGARGGDSFVGLRARWETPYNRILFLWNIANNKGTAEELVTDWLNKLKQGNLNRALEGIDGLAVDEFILADAIFNNRTENAQEILNNIDKYVPDDPSFRKSLDEVKKEIRKWIDIKEEENENSVKLQCDIWSEAVISLRQKLPLATFAFWIGNASLFPKYEASRSFIRTLMENADYLMIQLYVGDNNSKTEPEFIENRLRQYVDVFGKEILPKILIGLQIYLRRDNQLARFEALSKISYIKDREVAGFALYEPGFTTSPRLDEVNQAILEVFPSTKSPM